MGSKTNRTFFEEDVIKDRLEKEMYMDSNIISNAVVLAGPNCERHVKNLRRSICTTGKSKIIIPEINRETYLEQKKWFDSAVAKTHIQISCCGRNNNRNKVKTIALNKNVEIVNKDITDLTPERFIDADLMTSVVNGGDTILKLLRNQKNKFGLSTKKKGLLFTFSTRGIEIEKTLNFIKHMLKDELDTHITFLSKISMLPKKMSYRTVCSRYKTITVGGRVETFKLFMYRSCKGHPMITGLIVYR